MRATTMERDAVRRAFEPVDFFEIANLDHPREPIARGCHCLLYGPAGSGKTTLLFQFALIAAKRDPDARVLFVCRREAIEAAPPLLPQSSADLEAARRIHMKYLNDDAEVRKLASVLHLASPNELPSLIVLDDFSGFFGADRGGGGDSSGGGGQYGVNPHERRQREMRYVRTIAALCECASAIRPGGLAYDDDGADAGTERGGFTGRVDESSSARDDGDASCLLLVSESNERGSEVPSMTYLFQKWFRCALAIRPERPGEEEPARRPSGSGKSFVMERAWRPMDEINEGVAIRFEVDNAAATLVPTGFA